MVSLLLTLSIGSPLYATSDRTEIIIEEKVKETRLAIQALNFSLARLDESLAALETSLENQKWDISYSAISSISLASLSLGLNVLTYKILRVAQSEGSFLSGIKAILWSAITTFTSTLTTLLSSGFGFYDSYQNSRLNTDSLKAQIIQLRLELGELYSQNITSLSNRALIQQLDSHLKESQEVLSQMEIKEDEYKRYLFLTSVTQATGAFLMLVGYQSLQPHSRKLDLPPIFMMAGGIIMMAGGNISRIAISFTPSQKARLLSEIKRLRMIISKSTIHFD